LQTLQQNVESLTSGNFDPKAKLKFSPRGTPNRVSKKRMSIEETGYPSNTPAHKKLLRCYENKDNKPLFSIIHLSEKIKRRGQSLQKNINSLLDRVSLDRGLLIKEKMKCIWNDESAV